MSRRTPDIRVEGSVLVSPRVRQSLKTSPRRAILFSRHQLQHSTPLKERRTCIMTPTRRGVHVPRLKPSPQRKEPMFKSPRKKNIQPIATPKRKYGEKPSPPGKITHREDDLIEATLSLITMNSPETHRARLEARQAKDHYIRDIRVQMQIEEKRRKLFEAEEARIQSQRMEHFLHETEIIEIEKKKKINDTIKHSKKHFVRYPINTH
ncbi:hypothetical protein PCE1_002576 [Barthelona sp. PCE]